MGIAHDKGFIPDVQAPAQKYLTAMPSGDPLKTSIKVTDLLTMRCGLLWDESNYSEAENNCIVMELKDDWIDYVLTQPMDVEPGTKFVYNSGASVLLGKIVREATGIRIDKWAEQELFGPLGITAYHWKLTPLGEVDTEGGLYLTSEDLLKIGKLVMDKGRFNGKQIISEKWIEESTNPIVKFDENSGYGYQWWVPGFTPKVIAGNGYGGQFLFIVPEYETIVIFNGWNIHESPAKLTYRAFFERMLPALTH
jgi:CubicO group peptidase (beta-lactamase class C family)